MNSPATTLVSQPTCRITEVTRAARRAGELIRRVDADCGDAVTQRALVDALLAVEGLLDLISAAEGER